MDPLEVLAEKRAQEAQTPDAPSAAEAAREGGLDMTPSTEAGRALLEQEKYNSRSFTLISAENILAIEAQAVEAWREALYALLRHIEDGATDSDDPCVLHARTLLSASQNLNVTKHPSTTPSK